MGALDGIRVIDFGQYMAAPLAAMLLGDQGADVIRVDPPGGAFWDTAANATWNRNKRSIALDLKSPEDRERAARLIAGADVVIENFRPGVMPRLGLGPGAMTERHPRLVYCSLPGFARDDPRAGVRAYEGVVGAATATYRLHPRTGRPVYTAIPISSVYAAFQAALAIGAALHGRERDGLGQRIEVPLFDGTFAAMGNRLLRVHDRANDAGGTRRLAMRGVGGQLQCRDGRWVMYMGANQRARDFLEATGLAQWADAAERGEISVDALRERAEAAFRSRTALEWEELCAGIGTECGVCRSSEEWLGNEHALGSGIIADQEDPVLGRFRGPGLNLRMSATPGAIRFPRRKLDADREAILEELDRQPEPAPAPAASAPLRAAFEGIRVLDLCIVLAGPTCGRSMAELGADVIKIDGTARPIGGFHNDINRAKRSILLDLKSDAGREVFWKLVDTCDVVLQNFRKGVAERLGIDYQTVRRRKPDIIYASMNYAGHVGPYAERPGHEQIAQAVTGMQERFGGDGRPELQPFAVNDYGTGLMGAYAVALALYHRRRTGEGQLVDTSLCYTATMLQSSLLQRYAGKAGTEPRGQHALGHGPLHHAYAAADGWLFLGGRRADLERSPELAPYARLPDAELQQALQALLETDTVAAWVERLRLADLGAHAVIPEPQRVGEDPWVREHGLCMTREHDGFGPVTTNGPGMRLTRTPVAPGRPAPRPGSDAQGVLGEIGLHDETAKLADDGVILLDGSGLVR